MTIETSTITAYGRARSRLEDDLKRLEGYKQNLDLLEEQFKNDKAHIFFDYELNLSLSMDSLKEVGQLLLRLRNMGWRRNKLHSQPYQTGSADGTGSLVYNFIQGTDDELKHLSLRITLGPDASCRFTQVGTKTVEMPVYKLECD